MATRLGEIQRNGGAKVPPVTTAGLTPLSVKLVNGRRSEDVDLPWIGRARVELVGTTRSQEIESAMYRAMAALGIEQNGVTFDRFELERAVRILADAVRDPEDNAKPFGTLEEWGSLDNDVIGACWQVYGDVRERLDPLSTPLSVSDRLAIETAVKKKDARLLRSYGIAKLSAWLTTTDDLLSISPTPSSESSESSSDL